jgi:phenylacetate-CoA ligase
MYVRFHRTSGSRTRPLIVLDTAEDWQWWIDTWQFTLDAANLGRDDRVLMAFSFGPFIGFWTAHDAAVSRGALVVPGGGLSSLARLDLIRAQKITALFCTPSYALHLAEVAAQNQIDTQSLGVRNIIVAGEPGGSIPSFRERLEKAWRAQVVDHAGASEIGPWGYSDSKRRGLRIVESEFIAEFLALETGEPAADGELAELVLTTLGRAGCPVVRYRSGDLVRPRWLPDEDCRFVLLEGGVLGRTDDMLIIRGVNIFPTAVEEILRGFPEVDEFRMLATRVSHLDELEIEVEDRLNQPDRIMKELQIKLGLRVAVRCVAAGSLPRFEGKGKRFLDQR